MCTKFRTEQVAENWGFNIAWCIKTGQSPIKGIVPNVWQFKINGKNFQHKRNRGGGAVFSFTFHQTSKDMKFLKITL
jgi:cystathionine beta-lyase/cystathionine gamma-synthase